MASRLQQITIVLSVFIAARILLGLIANPMNDVRAELDQELTQVPVGMGSGGSHNDFVAIQNTLASRSTLWRELIPAPEAPKEDPVAATDPKAPDLAALLQGISVGRGQIGESKIRLHTPDAPKGEWVAVGTVINGCTLDSFTLEEVIFTYKWKEGGKELSIALPRL